MSSRDYRRGVLALDMAGSVSHPGAGGFLAGSENA